MAEELKKQNDWLVSTMNQPDFGLKDFVDVGLSVENTEFKDKDFYKSTQYFQDKFKDEDGNFDEERFNEFYDHSENAYKVFKTIDSITKFLDKLEQSYNDWGAPADSPRYDTQFELKKIPNAFKNKIGTENIGISKKSDLTYFEAAQANKLRDADGNILDVTANDLGALGTIFNTDAYVMDTWEEDGYHFNEDGRKIKHVKGEPKFDESGSPYLRALKPDEDVSTKRILNWTDVVTRDGSYWNKWDIFDSDGKEQNIAKSIARATLKVAPLLIPGVGGVYAGVTAAISLSQSLPSVIKAIDGIFNKGEGERNDVWKAFNKVQGWGNRFKGSTSEYAMEHAFAFENFATMFSDVPLQLSQQRLIAELPGMLRMNKLFMDEKKYNNHLMKSMTNQIMKHPERSATIMKNMSMAEVAAIRQIDINRFQNLTKSLSSSYMAITSVGDAWSQAIENGHDERTAGIITMGTLAGLYGLMRYTDVGNWALKGVGIDEAREGLKKTVAKELGELSKAYTKKMAGTAGTAVTEAEKTIFNKFKNAVSTFTNNLKNGSDTFKARLFTGAAAESIEEMSEETISDAMNVLANIGAFGQTEGKHNFTVKDMFARYTMSAIGGAVGGAMHVGIDTFKNRNSEVHKSIDADTREKIEYMVYKYGADSVKQEIEKQYKKGVIPADNVLSVSEFTKNKEGETVYSIAKGEEDTAAWQTKETLKNLVDSYAHILRGFTENDFDTDIQKAVFGQQKYDGLVGLESLTSVKEDFMKAVSNYIDARFETLDNTDNTTNEMTSRLTESANELEKFLKGEYFQDYAEMANFILDEELSQPFISTNINQFALARYKKPYEQLTESEKKAATVEYDDYSKESRTFQAKQAYRMFKEINEKYSPVLAKRFGEYKKIREIAEKEFVNFDKLLDKLKFDEQKLGELEKMKQDGIFDELSFIDTNKKIEETLMQINEKINMFAATGIDSIAGKAILDKLNDFKNITHLNFSKLNRFDYFRVSKNDSEIPNTIRAIFDIDPATFDLSEKAAQIDQLTITDQTSEYYIDPSLLGELHLDSTLATVIEEDSSMNDIYNRLKAVGVDTSDVENIVMDISNENQFEIYKEIMKEYSLYEINSQITSQNLKTTSQTINSLEERIQNMTTNPIYEMLDELGKTSNVNYSTAIEILTEEDKRLKDVRKITDYVLDNANRINELKQIKDNITVLKSVTNAAKTYQYDNDQYGYNQFTNDIRKAYAKKSENPLQPAPVANLLEVISNENAQAVIRDLQILENKIDYLIELSEYNNADKLRSHKKTSMKLQALQHQRLKEFINKLASEPNMPEDFRRAITKDLDKVTMGEYYYYLNSDSVNILDMFDANDETAMAEFESAMTSYENQIHDNFQSWINGRSGIDYKSVVGTIIDTLFPDKKQLIDERTSEMKETIENVTDYDALVYMMTTFSLRSSDFKSVLLEMIDNGEYDYAPVYGQEYPARIAIASVINSELFNAVINKIADEASKDGSEVNRFLNLSYISGYHGSGKTSATLNLVDGFLRRMGYETTATSIEVTQTENIKKSINADQAYTKSELLEKIKAVDLESMIKDNTDNLILDIGKVDAVIDTLIAQNNVDPIGFIKDIIYIDEVTNYTAFELAFVTRLAQRTGRHLIVFGDKLQEGAFFKGLQNDIEFGTKIQTPTLEFSMRANNIHQKDNNNKVRSITNLVNHRDFYNANDANKTDQIYAQTIASMEFNYHERNDSFTGNKIVSGITDADVINLVTKTKSGIIGYIYDNESSPAYQVVKRLSETTLKDKIKMLKKNEVQGLEMDHFIIDVDLTYKPKKYLSHSRLINTLFSRSRQGSIILKNGSDFTSIDKGYTRDTEIPKAERDAFKEYRKNILSKVLADNPADSNFLAVSKFNSEKKQNSQNNNTDNTAPLDDDTNALLTEYITEESGKQTNDPIPVGKPKTYMSYQTFSVLGGKTHHPGGDKNYNAIAPNQVRNTFNVKDKSKGEYVRDLQGFLVSDCIIAEDNDDYNLLQNALNELRRELLANKSWKGVNQRTKDKLFRDVLPDSPINADIKNQYKWNKGKFKIVISKDSPDIRRYQGSGQHKLNTYIAQLVYEVENNESGKPDLELTIADLHNDTVMKDYKSLIGGTLGNITIDDVAYNTVYSDYITDFGDKLNAHGGANRFHRVKGYRKTLRDLETNTDGYIVSDPKIVTRMSMGTDVVGSEKMPVDPKDIGRPRIFICTEPNQKFPNGESITADNIDQYYAEYRKQEYRNMRTGENSQVYKDIVQWYHLNSSLPIPNNYKNNGGQFRVYMDKYFQMFNNVGDQSLDVREIDTFNDPYNAARMLFSIYSAHGVYQAKIAAKDTSVNKETADILHQTVATMSLYLRLHPVYDVKTGELIGIESRINDWEHSTDTTFKPNEFESIDFKKMNLNDENGAELKTNALKRLFKTDNNRGFYSIMHVFGELFGAVDRTTGLPTAMKFKNLDKAYSLFDTILASNAYLYDPDTKKTKPLKNTAAFPNGIYLHPKMAAPGSSVNNFVQNMFVTEEMKDMFYIDVIPRGQAYILDLSGIKPVQAQQNPGQDANVDPKVEKNLNDYQNFLAYYQVDAEGIMISEGLEALGITFSDGDYDGKEDFKKFIANKIKSAKYVSSKGMTFTNIKLNDINTHLVGDLVNEFINNSSITYDGLNSRTPISEVLQKTNKYIKYVQGDYEITYSFDGNIEVTSLKGEDDFDEEIENVVKIDNLLSKVDNGFSKYKEALNKLKDRLKNGETDAVLTDNFNDFINDDKTDVIVDGEYGISLRNMINSQFPQLGKFLKDSPVSIASDPSSPLLQIEIGGYIFEYDNDSTTLTVTNKISGDVLTSDIPDVKLASIIGEIHNKLVPLFQDAHQKEVMKIFNKIFANSATLNTDISPEVLQSLVVKLKGDEIGNFNKVFYNIIKTNYC